MLIAAHCLLYDTKTSIYSSIMGPLTELYVRELLDNDLMFQKVMLYQIKVYFVVACPEAQ